MRELGFAKVCTLWATRQPTKAHKQYKNALHYTNAQLCAMISSIEQKTITHHPYSLDLASSACLLFGPLKGCNREQQFITD